MRTWINLIEKVAGDFLDEVLYHGTDAAFDEFDLSKNRTARHIYTSPDINTARFYGDILYECRVRGPQADITHEGDPKLLRTLAETYADHFEEEVKHGEAQWGEPFAHVQEVKERIAQRLLAQHASDPDYTDLDAQWDAEEDEAFRDAVRQGAIHQAFTAITGGSLYTTTSYLQDAVLEEVFAMGYNSIRFTDPSSEGESISVVARTPSDVQIIRSVQ